MRAASILRMNADRSSIRSASPAAAVYPRLRGGTLMTGMFQLRTTCGWNIFFTWL